MNETVIQFGASQSLVGVVNEPTDHVPGSPVAILINAGVVHRSGPFRLYVDIARELAACGFASMRMDLSGLGDSAVRKDLSDGQDRAVLDLGDAFECLGSRFESDRYVLIGLCSGAYNAHQVAVDDGRVAGAVFLDGLVYPTKEHQARRARRRRSPRFLRNAVKRRMLADAVVKENEETLGAEEFFELDKSSEQVAEEIRQMLARQMQLLFLYTEGYKEITSRSQFEEMFGIVPDEQQVQVEYYANFEHTLRLTAHRAEVVKRIATWYGECFSVDVSAACPGEPGASRLC